jgi:maltooligosyltrehalose trehalohydrolase
MSRHRHRMPFGAELLEADQARFRLWAPSARAVALRLGAPDEAVDIPMRAEAGGWYAAEAPARAGAAYAFRIDGGPVVPDPASRCNPQGVHGESRVVDPLQFAWDDESWRGRPWEEAVIYELHVGSFTPQGTFAAVIERLDPLADLGVTAIELMPVAAFPGARNWGYDGVLPFAPAAAYGAPDDLKRLVQAAHRRGLMVLLDVVYNHFGPEGNYLHLYARDFFDAARQTPWGAAINFAARPVRDFFIHNALYWLEEYRMDGLRLDAVHAIRDDSQPDIVAEIAAAIHAGPGRQRHVHLILENDANAAHYLAREADGRPRLATAQWNDDFHHATHVLASGEADGYYADYAAAPLAHLGRCLAEGFAWQGEPSPYRGGAPRGEPSGHLPPTAFVAFLQNHDQIGNRACGERLATLNEEAPLRALAACLLLAPQVPLLFMGEEFGARTPFLFFCDFGAELGEAVSAGRRAEFARFERFASAEARAAIPDPQDPATFARSRLAWAQAETEPGRRWLALYRELLRARREHIIPRLAGARAGHCTLLPPSGLALTWPLGEGARLHLLANLGPAPLTGAALPAGLCLYHSEGVGPDELAPWAVYASLAAADEGEAS